jgi:hypothetical protein
MICYKPVIPSWVKIVFPIMHVLEAAAIYVGFPLITGGLSGWFGVCLYTCLVFFLRLTPIPLIATPVAVLGASAVAHIPWLLSAPVFAAVHVYSWFFLRDYRVRTQHLSIRSKQDVDPRV